MEDIIGIIPAAGKGSRLGLPYPKELFPVIRNNRYKPVSQFIVENLTAAGVKHIVFVINSTKHQLLEYFGNGNRFNCHTSYVIQESLNGRERSTSPGLAHALDSAYHLIRGKKVFFGMADTIMKPLDVFTSAHNEASRSSDYDVILILFETDRPEKFGMVQLEHGNRVIKIIDKPQRTSLTKMWGSIIWQPSFTEHLKMCVRDLQVLDFAEIMNSAIQRGMRFQGVVIPDSTYHDIGTYDEISEIINSPE